MTVLSGIYCPASTFSMRIKGRDIILAVLTVLLIAALVGYLMTRESADSRAARQPASKPEPAPTKLVDQTPLETAHSVASIASTTEEQKLAAEAYRLADKEVDLSFASALQFTELHPPLANSTTKEINDRISRMSDRLQAAQQSVTRLTAQTSTPSGKNSQVFQQQLEVSQARVTLLQDALDDAREDLMRAGGDPQAEIKQELEEHEALAHNSSGSSSSNAKPTTLSVAGNLLSQFKTWRNLRTNYQRLVEAEQQASSYLGLLTRKHQALEKGMTDVLGSDDESADDQSTPALDQSSDQASAAQVTKLKGMSKDSRLMAMYDKRIQAEQQLAAIYVKWAVIVQAQERIALHAIMRSLLLILLALIGIVLAEGFIERFYMSMGPDRRRLGTMRLVLRFISQLIGVLVILLVVFGLPSQLSTVLALGAAGLTVALKDFLVAFFGWFVLMGRHGIRAGDWVEINGIGGEVVEVGLLRTILLETGNWNDAGHPTGRTVSFVNSYAIEGHYFNFTTAGQWLWDELDVLIPSGEDPYYLTNSVLKLVAEQTQQASVEAESEWKQAARRSSIQNFSAQPAIDVRPTSLGVNLVVRYVVNAHTRYEVRTRLYQAIVELLHTDKSARVTVAPLPANPVQP
jgi:small-conductance mechanosensitive channel